jgi:xylulokinase
MALLLGLDIGTTSTVGIVIDSEGGTLALASRPVELHTPQLNRAEEDPEEWWANVGAISRELLASAGIGPEAIAGIGVTGMLPAIVLLDRQGAVLRRSIQQNDARAVQELARFAAGMEESEFLALTGTGYSQQLVGPKLMWVREHEPEIFAATQHVLGASDYITWRLTNRFGTEHNWALESGFSSLFDGAYDDRLLALAGIDRALLPPIRLSHEVVGSVTPEAGRHLGLKPGIPVVAGCADHVASAFVCGARRNGDLVLKFGGAADILLAADRAVTDRRLFIDHHIVPGLWFPNGCMAAGGNLLNWIIANLGAAEAVEAKAAGLTPHRWLDAKAMAAGPGAGDLLFLPYVLGEKTPLMDPHARGTIVGLGLHHKLKDIWRAALEGIVFGFRHHFEIFAENGLVVSRAFAADGGAASDLWLQIAADGLGLPVRRIDHHPGSCLGAAFVAGVGIGAIRDFGQIETYVAQGRLFRPDSAAAERMSIRYRLWRETYTRLKSLYPRLT